MTTFMMTLAIAALSVATPAAVVQEQAPMPTDQEVSNRQLIEDAFARWASGDFDIFSLLTDDATWHITFATGRSIAADGATRLGRWRRCHCVLGWHRAPSRRLAI